MKHPQVITPGGPRKPAFSPMLRRQRIAGMTRIESTGWVRQNDNSETYTLTAHFEDGDKAEARHERMVYEKGQREKIIERAFSGRATLADFGEVMRIRNERSMKAETLYGQLQHDYGKGAILE